jgi:uncharacterized membrane protein
VTKGDVIAALFPASSDPRESVTAAREAFVIGAERSLEKDAGFAVQQLVEIALRALSPAVNEPFTAIAAIDWLGGSLAALAERRTPSATRTDDSGRARVVTDPRTFVTLLREALEPIALRAGRTPEVVSRLLAVLARLALVAQRPEDRQAIADVSRTCGQSQRAKSRTSRSAPASPIATRACSGRSTRARAPDFLPSAGYSTARRGFRV